jgi:hypothetical protein
LALRAVAFGAALRFAAGFAAVLRAAVFLAGALAFAFVVFLAVTLAIGFLSLSLWAPNHFAAKKIMRKFLEFVDIDFDLRRTNSSHLAASVA